MSEILERFVKALWIVSCEYYDVYFDNCYVEGAGKSSTTGKFNVRVWDEHCDSEYRLIGLEIPNDISEEDYKKQLLSRVVLREKTSDKNKVDTNVIDWFGEKV
jgi:hypothetical protein